MLQNSGVHRWSLKKRVTGTIICLCIYRLLACIPLPFIRMDVVTGMDQNNTLALFNLMTGGSMFKMTIGALGVSPYITASIFIHLMSVMSPSLQNLQKSGFIGRRRIQRMTVALSILTSLPTGLMLLQQYQAVGAVSSHEWYVSVVQLGLLIANGVLLSYMGMYIDDHLFGNGLSLILVTGIVSGLPTELGSAFAALNEGKTVVGQIMSDSMFVLLVLGLMLFMCWMLECGVNLPLVGSQKFIDDDEANMIQNVLPLRMLTTNVMPIILASSIFSLPLMLFQTSGEASWVYLFDMTKWFSAQTWWASFGVIIYFALICLFGRYAQLIDLNEVEMSETLRKSGFIIRGLSPGRETESFLKMWMGKLNRFGSIGLCVVALAPIVVGRLFNIPSISLLGTSLILIINIIRDTWNNYKIERHGLEYTQLLPILESKRKGDAFCLLEKARLNG